MTPATLIALCQCGCGEPAPIAPCSHKSRGWVKGQPRAFRQGHHVRARFGTDAPAQTHSDRYRAVRLGSRPRVAGEPSAYAYEHRLIVERAIGRPLDRRHHVHHVNGDKLDNRNSNLVACEDAAYHRLLHARTKARDATGNPDARQCWVCRQWDVPGQHFRVPAKGNGAYHRSCVSLFEVLERRVGSTLALAWLRTS